mgnify:CR=1 FL=1|tara:strand:- start:218 stop:373 length:156 start_codon:yes stop_codon:yes gene_type:complete
MDYLKPPPNNQRRLDIAKRNAMADYPGLDMDSIAVQYDKNLDEIKAYLQKK